MTKKKVTKMNPTITNIPIAVSENPVVIDLPDGQKLVLGRLNAGSVIEVATSITEPAFNRPSTNF